ncbi:MAG: hypothetical protein ACUVXF_04995 [Desulfobaccales bacterium]
MIKDRRTSRRLAGAFRARGLGLLLLAGFLALPTGTSAAQKGPEVRNLGISRLGDRTMVTILLDQAVTPRVSPFVGKGKSQLVVEFPLAWAGKLPERLVGDEVLVKQLRTEVSAAGVKIIVDMNPDQYYIWKRETHLLSGGRATVRLTFRPDPGVVAAKPPSTAALPAQPPPLAPRAPETTATPPSEVPSPGVGEEIRAEPPPAPLIPPAPTPATPPGGAFAELYRLLPEGKGLLDHLRGEGWGVAQAKDYDRPGIRLSRVFYLTNPRYPEMRVRIAHVPPNAPGSPTINIFDLAMDNVSGRSADEYRKLRQWSFGQIKGKYEDIGDFFDDALKPLRVELRQQCQTLAQHHAAVLKGFMGQAVPRQPQLGDKALTLISKKVSPRFEGVQYTLSENPLVILNLVDFLYIRVYYLGG